MKKAKIDQFKKKKIFIEGDDDDLIRFDNDQDKNNEESEGKYQRKERTNDNLELDH